MRPKTGVPQITPEEEMERIERARRKRGGDLFWR